MTDINTESQVLSSIDERGVARLTLNRPEKHNAFNAEIIKQLTDNLIELKNNSQVRALILMAEGKNFSAGGDLNWMKSMRTASEQENIVDAQKLATLLFELNNFPLPTIARVQGAAFGGAVGLISCCDMAVAVERSKFCLSEVKLGLSPATIGPYVVSAMGAQQARRYFLTAEVFTAAKAQQLGMLHEVVADEAGLDEQVNAWLNAIISNGPQALEATKKLIATIDNSPLSAELVSPELKQYTSEVIAKLRISDEGQEGLSAFFEKRKAAYNLTEQ